MHVLNVNNTIILQHYYMILTCCCSTHQCPSHNIMRDRKTLKVNNWKHPVTVTNLMLNQSHNSHTNVKNSEEKTCHEIFTTNDHTIVRHCITDDTSNGLGAIG